MLSFRYACSGEVDMTFRNQPRCLTPSHLTTNHMTSYHITSQHSTSHHHHGNKTSHHQTSLDHRERLKGRAQKNSVFVIALVGGLVIGKFFRGFIGSLPLKLPPPDAPELLLFADSDTVHMAGVQNSRSKGSYKVGPIGIAKLILHLRYEAGPIGNHAVPKLGASIALAWR